VEVSEADVVELAEEAPEIVAEAAEPVVVSADGPDSAVDLGLPAVSSDPNGSGSDASNPSGISVIEWASLVEEGPPHAETAAASFDDPADADLIGQAHEPAAAAPPQAAGSTEPTLALPPVADDEDALATDLAAVRTIFSGDASASFAKRGPAE